VELLRALGTSGHLGGPRSVRLTPELKIRRSTARPRGWPMLLRRGWGRDAARQRGRPRGPRFPFGGRPGRRVPVAGTLAGRPSLGGPPRRRASTSRASGTKGS